MDFWGSVSVRRVLTCAVKSANPFAFANTASIRKSDVKYLPRSSAYIVSKAIRTFGSAYRRMPATSMPFRPGILTSKIIKSGSSSFAFDTASVPSTASPQTTKVVSRSIAWRMIVRTNSLSSAMRIVFGLSEDLVDASAGIVVVLQVGRTHYTSSDNTAIPVAPSLERVVIALRNFSFQFCFLLMTFFALCLIRSPQKFVAAFVAGLSNQHLALWGHNFLTSRRFGKNGLLVGMGS